MNYEVITADCLEHMRTMPDNAVDAVVTDPPYFRVKGEAWDRQWKDRSAFLSWMGELCAEWQRVLRPNGSLWVFASPKMAAGVECKIGEFFNVLNHITWKKSSQCYAAKYGPENFRQFVPMTERIIFAEHHGADNIAKGEAGYVQAGYVRKCDELRGFVFEPLRAYLAGEMARAGHSLVSVNKAWREWKGGNGGMSSHWFTTSQWMLPTAENYQWLRDLFNGTGGEYLRREYEDLRREYEDLRRDYEDLRRDYEYLRRDYEDLRREYEDLRRPFAVTAEDQYTDVWEFQTVPASPGKHVCEKPLPLMRHIIKASTKLGAVVLDCFAGSGSTGCAAVELGRAFIGIEKDELWAQRARARIAHHAAQGVLNLEEAT